MVRFRDRLAHLKYRQVLKLLGPGAEKLLDQGGRLEIDPVSQVQIDEDCLTLNLHGLTARLQEDVTKPGRLAFSCSRCREVCLHVGAAFSQVLEEKMALGLGA